MQFGIRKTTDCVGYAEQTTSSNVI